ncbi:hypothetical protein BTW07_05620 [Salinicola socius]|uniref:HEPN AbiJ-N-terminal domain-containing protein n=2 Tax=Salinicola socius TaxID=404433 RepID=A0A1Q8SUQ7_9GAMM|nr:hypothetical protein BTW07_05620 [Salinicola socius]
MALRNSLWNAFDQGFLSYLRAGHAIEESYYLRRFYLALYESHLKLPTHYIDLFHDSEAKKLFRTFSESPWYEVYDILEFVVNWVESNIGNGRRSLTIGEFKSKNIEKYAVALKDIFNNKLERENSGFRFVGTVLVQVTSDTEIKAIEQGVAQTDRFSPVGQHLASALHYLTSKTDRDYRNSVKESVLSLESLCKIVTGDKAGTLGQLLKELEKQKTIPPTMSAAYSKIYGFSSQPNGIRHGMLDEDEIGYDEALYMLVVCSAFVNYVTKVVGQ